MKTLTVAYRDLAGDEPARYITAGMRDTLVSAQRTADEFARAIPTAIVVVFAPNHLAGFREVYRAVGKDVPA